MPIPEANEITVSRKAKTYKFLFEILQGSSWNSNLLKWASGFMSSSEQAKNTDSNVAVSFYPVFVPPF